MIQSLILCVAKCLNAFTTKGGIYKNDPIHDSLRKINPDFNQERIVFGAYALVYTCTINGINTRSIPPIALNDSDNHIGDYFIRLYTGKRLHSYEWTELPIDKKNHRTSKAIVFR